MDILLIEDDIEIRDWLERFLRRLGHDVVACGDGEAGLAAYGANNFPVVLCDIVLPHMTGLDFLKAVAGSPRPEGSSVLLMTAYSNVESAIEALKLGAYDYLVKPINLKQLTTSLDRIIEMKQLEGELARSREKLAESETHYRGLIENLSDAFSYCKVIVDGEGCPVDLEFVSVNPIFERVLGRKVAEVVGKRFVEVFPEADRKSFPWIEALGQVALTGHPIAFEQPFALDGRWYRNSVYSPQAGYVAIISHDITEKKRIEVALQESELKYRMLFENVNDAIFLLEIDSEGKSGHIREVNDVACARLGYSREELLSFSITAIDPFLSPEEWKEYGLRLTSQGVDTFERTHRAKDGTLIPVEISSRHIVLGGTAFRLSVARDLTERKCTEKILKTSYERMRRDHLLNELLEAVSMTEQKVYENLVTAGLKMAGPLTCFLLVLQEWKGKSRGYWKQHLEELRYLQDLIVDLLGRDERWVVWRSAGGIGILYSGELLSGDAKQHQKELAAQIRGRVEGNFPELKVAIGIAESTTNMADFCAIYRQSCIAVNTGRRIWPDRKIYHYLDIGMFQVLPSIVDQDATARFVQRNLGKLMHYDTDKKTELIATLEAILENNHLKEAAEKLFVHLKTIEFRKNRIEKVLGVSLDHVETRMTLMLAVRLLRIGQGEMIGG